MRYFVPDFVLASRLAAQSMVEDKIGGLPFGVDAFRWPRCAECGGVMSHIGQFRHDERRLDLGSVDRVLCAFQCEHDPGRCANWSPTSGANAVLVLDLDRGAGRAEPPGDALVYPEIRVRSWSSHDDGIAESDVGIYFDDAGWIALAPEGRSKPAWGTKLSGVPMWVASTVPSELPDGEFVLQLDSGNVVTGTGATPEETGWGRQTSEEGSITFDFPHANNATSARVWLTQDEAGWSVLGPNFGNGMAYVFLDRRSDPPVGTMLWQC